MPKYPPITEAQVKEMWKLRKEGGYSNPEIANRLGISTLSVRRHIGPEGTERKAAANLKIVHQQITLQGDKSVYQLDVNNGVMAYREIPYTIDELKTLLAELSEILAMLEKGRSNREKMPDVS